jgi:hypothetical protein
MFRDRARSLLGSATLFIGGVAIAVCVPNASRWFAGRGLHGVWAQVGLAFGIVVAFGTLAGMARIVAGGVSVRQIARPLVFGLAVSLILLGWIAAVQVMMALLRSQVHLTLSPLVHIVLLIAGFMAVVLGADRAAPRFGVTLRRRRRV